MDAVLFNAGDILVLSLLYIKRF